MARTRLRPPPTVEYCHPPPVMPPERFSRVEIARRLREDVASSSIVRIGPPVPRTHPTRRERPPAASVPGLAGGIRAGQRPNRPQKAFKEGMDRRPAVPPHPFFDAAADWWQSLAERTKKEVPNGGVGGGGGGGVASSVGKRVEARMPSGQGPNHRARTSRAGGEYL